jgi:hypothetical protein
MTHSPPLVDDFMTRIEQFLRRTGMTATAFGRHVANDGSFVSDLKVGGREVRISTIEKVEKFMDGFDAGVAHAGRRASLASSDIRRSAAGS